MARKETAEYEIKLKDKLSNPLKRATGSATKLDSAMSKTGKSTGGFLDVMKGNVVSSAIMGAASALAEFAKFAVSAGVKMEQTRISFQTMVGDVKKGNELFSKVAEFANVTPFSTEGVQKGARTLLAFGVQADAIIPTLGVLGDISAGTGKDLSELGVIYGQIKGAGKLMGQDLLQLINAGFNPLQQISKKTGESMGELKDRMSKGAISFSEVQGAFIDATSAGGLFYQMSEKQSKTLGGLWSTLIGKVTNSIGLFMESNSGLLKGIISGGLEVFNFFSSSWAAVVEVFEPLTTLISQTFAEISGLFNVMSEGVTITDMLKGAFNFLGKTIRFLMPLFKFQAKIWIFVFKVIKKTFDQVVNLYNGIIKLGNLLQGFTASVIAGFKSIAGSAKTILGGVGDLLSGIFSGDVDQIKKGLSGLDNAFSQAGKKSSVAFGEAYKTESEDFFKNEGGVGLSGPVMPEQTKTLADFVTPTAPGTTNGAKGGKKTQASTSVASAASGRPTNINIEIGKLIENFTVETTTLENMEIKVKNAVSKALVSAVNDVNLVAR